jgi:putative oxidoreductase
MKKFFSTSDDTALTLLRIALGVVMFPHGAQKVLGWFGGYGWTGTMGFMTGTLGIPAALAALVFIGEFFGSIGLITGFLGRLSAFGIFATMLGAVAMVHAKVGFFMNWSGTLQGEGYEFHILAAAMALAIIIKGSGAYSVDRVIAERIGK